MPSETEMPAADLSDVVEQVISQLSVGQPADVESLCQRHPQLRQRLEAMMPAVRAMAEFGRNAAEQNEQQTVIAGPARTVFAEPEQLGDFRILRELGRGGMGVVYEAEQLSLRRRVAVKVLPFAAVLDPRQLRRFHNEAQAAAALQHPHIVSVHAVGFDRGVHFYAMDLVVGQSLAEIIRELRDKQRPSSGKANPEAAKRLPGVGSTSPAAADLSLARCHNRREFYFAVAELGVQAARALDYAHECGIVHRDIKPSNLLVDRRAELWVTDFGLAMTRAETGLTLTGDLLGTVRYMSPEQAAGDWSRVNHRTDIYSLGISLYELLALRPAFPDKDRQVLLRKIDETDAPRLRAIDNSLPRDLETVIMKATAKEPVERYATAAEMADDLQRFIDVKPVRARRFTRFSAGGRWVRRNPGLATASLVAVLLTGLMAVAGPILALRQTRLLQDVQQAAETERYQRQQRSQLTRRLELQLYDAKMAKAHAAVLHHEFERAEQILTSCAQPRAAGHRSFEWYHLWWNCQRALDVPQQLRLGDATWHNSVSVHCARYAPDGRSLAIADRSGDVALYDASSLELVWDRRQFRHASGEIRMRPAEDAHADQVHDLLFTPDAQLVITGSRDQTVKIWEAATGRLLATKSFAESKLVVSALAVTPDGRAVVIGFARVKQDSLEPVPVSIWRLRRVGNSVRVEPGLENPLPGLVGHVFSLAISPDGRWLVAGSRNHQIRVFDLENQRPVAPLAGHSATVRAVVFSPQDANLLATASYQESVTNEGAGEVKLWDMARRAEIATLHRTGWYRCVAFSADGNQLAAGDHDGTLRVWDVESRGLLQEIPAHGRQINAIAFTPCGESMLTVSHDRTAKVWNLPELPHHPQRFSGHGASILRLAISPDGRRLLSAGTDGIARLWDTGTGKSSILRTGSHMRFLTAADFSADGRFVAVGGGDWKQLNQPVELTIWETNTRRRTVLFSQLSSQTTGKLILGVAFSPDGDRVAAGIGEDILIWSVHDGRLLARIAGDNGSIDELAWCRQSNRLASLNMDPAFECRLWDGDSGDQLAVLPIPADVSHPWRMAFSPDGQTLAVGTLDGEILLYDLAACSYWKRLSGHTDWVMDVAFSPDGRRLASASWDRTVKLWNLETDTDLLTFRDARNPVSAVRFSPDGLALYGTADHLEYSVIHIWRAAPPRDAG
jgi:WD40 repeat protein/serine/threonine protein kinase